MQGQLSLKVALLTGGASGIGQAISELLAREGSSVVIGRLSTCYGACQAEL
ncbi:SDR family NAD(P)-dependent oxidoreductase [Bradyrhizobium sp. C-145]|uniref:SDR family NAD(P)-dependent oxidoreductase n=1 Tax=Bradyrhizobium sp. C-145 TaxID=574727 RepID=UPI002111F656|nr:SDR family NAD(P)-dependent oxidoreductase [Bradyrhizobium sp. C-145]